ncbi:MAG: YbbR-like domain-containing protein [Candidatus Omnitrophota bacterium]
MGWNNIIFNNFLAKIISLVLAVATWFYVFDVVNRDSFIQKKETVEEVFSRYKFVMKEVPVKPVFEGRSPEGYKTIFEKVKIEPAIISVFGPEEIVEDLDGLETETINLGEYTRSIKLSLGLQSDIKFLSINDKVVDVYLPIEPEKAATPKPQE